MKFKIKYSSRNKNLVAKKFISSTIVAGLFLNNTSSLASVLSEDGRYEAFEGNNITINDVLEEDTVDIEVEGNTMVNVATQKDPVPITKKYTVNDTNHIPLQGEYDGKAKPVIEGNTVVNLLGKHTALNQGFTYDENTGIYSLELDGVNIPGVKKQFKKI